MIAEKLFHLPTYDEAQEQVGQPPAYTTLYATSLPQTVIEQPVVPPCELESGAHGAQTAWNTASVTGENTSQLLVAGQVSQHTASQVLSGMPIPSTMCRVNTGTVRTLNAANTVKSAEQGAQMNTLEPLETVPVELDERLVLIHSLLPKVDLLYG